MKKHILFIVHILFILTHAELYSQDNYQEFIASIAQAYEHIGDNSEYNKIFKKWMKYRPHHYDNVLEKWVNQHSQADIDRIFATCKIPIVAKAYEELKDEHLKNKSYYKNALNKLAQLNLSQADIDYMFATCKPEIIKQFWNIHPARAAFISQAIQESEKTCIAKTLTHANAYEQSKDGNYLITAYWHRAWYHAWYKFIYYSLEDCFIGGFKNLKLWDLQHDCTLIGSLKKSEISAPPLVHNNYLLHVSNKGIVMRDIKRLKKMGKILPHKKADAVFVCNNGNYIVSSGNNKTKVWDMTNGVQRNALPLYTFKENCIGASSRYIAIHVPENHTINILDATNQFKRINQFDDGITTRVTFSPCESYMVSDSTSIWDLQQGSEIAHFNKRLENYYVSDDEKYIILKTELSCIIFDIENKRVINSYEKYSAALNQTDGYFITLHNKMFTLLDPFNEFKSLATLYPGSKKHSFFLTNNGDYFVSSVLEKDARHIKITNMKPLRPYINPSCEQIYTYLLEYFASK